MASIIGDCQGKIMIDYLEQDRSINGAYYTGKLRQLRQKVARQMAGKLTCGVLFLQEQT